MASGFGISGGGEPLFFFYDCEATGLHVGWDVIIEVAAVLYTKDLDPGLRELHEFSSLCRSSKVLHPEAELLTGLTKEALKNEPKVRDVLNWFFDWIKETVKKVSTLEGRAYIPVLAAHGGHMLDFPLLTTAVRKIGVKNPDLQRKFDKLNLHYADTLSVFKQPDVAEKNKLETFRLKDIYKALLGCPLDGHRALEDAKALHRIFSEAKPADELVTTLRNYIQSKEGKEIVRQQIRRFKDAKIKVPKAVELLQKKITYEDLQTQSQKSEESFIRFLKEKCGIADPDRELVEHFKGLSLD